jgi:NAD+ kinase
MRVKIIPNPEKKWAVDMAKELEPFLGKHGHAVEESGAEATVCIGGDGTVLYSNHTGMIEGPVVGIGSQSSYICQLMRTSPKEDLIHLLESGKTASVMTLKATIDGKSQTAINDFVVHSKDYRVLDIRVEDSKGKYHFQGDGIIVSSALGSAGYAYSAGGEKLEPLGRKISVVPICPYRRVFSPTVLNDSASVSIAVDRGCAFIVDGIFLQDLKKDETVVIEKGEDITFFEGVGFYKQGGDS